MILLYCKKEFHQEYYDNSSSDDDFDSDMVNDDEDGGRSRGRPSVMGGQAGERIRLGGWGLKGLKLEGLAAQFGLKLVKKWSFAEFFKHNVGHKESLTLLSSMQALEPFPSVGGTEPMSADKDDYKFANELLSTLMESQSHPHGHHRPPRIGTLSQAEWDAATIYLVFIFEKVEDIVPAFRPDPASHTSASTTDTNNGGGGDLAVS
ncbi:mRNA cap guanine-N7 methyltransferase [Elysia marginata]|uniref:mRNA cap guanine-N7 methyltransferase n=1 Tax=Elysia marginata TaxID=1093978 RepID=A0AAV4JDI7_9GAST|nr:mRNA cap guanine-N7 methyltransferase [Elysia marginata]